MKSLFLMVLTILLCNASYADGFICADKEGSLTVKVFNHVSPELGTRRGAVMVLSNPQGELGKKTLAVFRESNKVLFNSGSTYISYIDYKHEESSQLSQEIVETKIDEIYSLVLDIKFDYNHPVLPGQNVDGELVVVKNNGDKIFVDLSCRRYLKNTSIDNRMVHWYL